MANALLGAKAVGSIVKLKVNGAPLDFIVVHQGLPSSMYDESCNGTWLLMKNCYEKQKWQDSNLNSYESSAIHGYLNSTFLNLLDKDIQSQIKQVKIPYRPGSGTSSGVASGAKGLSTKIFSLAVKEVNKGVAGIYLPEDGTILAYFENDSDACRKAADIDGKSADWFTRTPHANYSVSSESVYYIRSGGALASGYCKYDRNVRPALILPPSLLVLDDGAVTTNTAPTTPGSITIPDTIQGGSTINVSWTASTDAENNLEGYIVEHSIDGGDGVTVTEAIDGENLRSFQAVPDETYTFTVSGETFIKVLNGNHTLTITASDGKADTVHRLLFQKAISSALIALVDAVPADARIAVCVLSVSGSIPADAHFKVKVTNNGLDNEPAWEDCINEVKAGANHVFTNETQTNGWAFNFKVTASRGPSGQGGYINSVQGGFQ